MAGPHGSWPAEARRAVPVYGWYKQYDGTGHGAGVAFSIIDKLPGERAMPFPARVSCWPSRGRLHGADMIVLAPGLAGTDAPWSAVPVSGAGRTACLRRGQAGLPWSTAHAKGCWPCLCSQIRESIYGRFRRKAESRPRIAASSDRARRCPAAQAAFVHRQPLCGNPWTARTRGKAAGTRTGRLGGNMPAAGRHVAQDAMVAWPAHA